HDDWGGQYSPFFSPATVREMILPYLKRIVDFLHARGMYLHFHSCGKIELLVPAMIEAGVDVWCGQPINDRLAVLKEYGGRIKLEAEPLAFDKTYTEEEIKPAVTDFLDLYGPYINDIIVLNHSNKEEVYELVYAYSRKKLAT
ncbi:MAG: hypothetical protein LBL63_05640, partial [Clostridiales Family XIII bacterium]|nr:hypothetical protein [Clostridiales Family XIII bacterium]